MLQRCNERLIRLKGGLGLETERPILDKHVRAPPRSLAVARNPCAFGEKCQRLHEAKHRLAFAHPEQPDEAMWAEKAELEDGVGLYVNMSSSGGSSPGNFSSKLSDSPLCYSPGGQASPGGFSRAHRSSISYGSLAEPMPRRYEGTPAPRNMGMVEPTMGGLGICSFFSPVFCSSFLTGTYIILGSILVVVVVA